MLREPVYSSDHNGRYIDLRAWPVLNRRPSATSLPSISVLSLALKFVEVAIDDALRNAELNSANI